MSDSGFGSHVAVTVAASSVDALPTRIATTNNDKIPTWNCAVRLRDIGPLESQLSRSSAVPSANASHHDVTRWRNPHARQSRASYRASFARYDIATATNGSCSLPGKHQT